MNYVLEMLLFCCIFSVVYGTTFEKQSKIKKIDVYALGVPCPRYRNLSWIITAQRSRLVNDNFYVNFTLTGKKDAPINARLTINIQRCRNRENPDTCEDFFTFRRGFCQLLGNGDGGPIFKTFISAVKPNLVCPLKKGAYIAKNSYVNMAAFLLFPTESWVWKVKISTIGDNIMQECCITEIKVFV